MKSKEQQNKKQLYLCLGTIVVVILLLVTTRFVMSHKGKKVASVPLKVSSVLPANAIASGEGSYAIPTNVKGQMEFISPKLGISFFYMADLGNGQSFMTKEEGTRVYLVDAQPYPGYDYHKDSDFVEVFTKKPQDSLTTSIQNTILKGYSQTTCPVVASQPIKYQIPLPTNIETATIEPVADKPLPLPRWDAAQKCHPPYAPANDQRYFFMDKNYPTKYAFFFLGQTGFPSGQVNMNWEQTLQINP